MRKYGVSAVIRALREPGRIVGEIRRLSTKINGYLSIESKKFDMMDADWDILIILDACRHDLFRSASTLSGKTEVVNSGASQSREFMKTHFEGCQHHDTVYISANPYTHELDQSIFHDITNLYVTDWDDDIGTVKASAVAEAAKEIASKYEDKRLVIHFLQPHYPFISSVGRSFDSGKAKFGVGDDIWTQLRSLRCPVKKSIVWKAYKQNYLITEPKIRELDSEINGKMVVTSDHGNLFGERMWPIPVRGYGHTYAEGLTHKALREVPWHEMPTSDRREITTEQPREAKNINYGEIDDKLEALGYK